MDAKSSYRCRKWSTIIGCYLLISTTGLLWYWGNMSVYVVSLILSYEAPTSYILAPWTASMFMISMCTGYMACGVMLKFTSVRIVMFVGAVLGSCGSFLSYITIVISMTYFNITMGFLFGIGNGLVNCACFQYAAMWAENDVGFLMGLVQSSTNFGGIVTNPLLTLYVNPSDESADMTVGGLKFFSQEDVIGNVASLILVLGCVHLLLKIIGFAMLRMRNTNNTLTPEPLSIELNESSTIFEEERRQSNGGSLVFQLENSTAEMTWVQMIRCKEFYLMLSAFVSVQTACFLMLTYYKVFGQLYIRDDHFLANIGTYMNIACLAGNVLWGYAMDRLGVKNTLVVLLSFLILLGSFYFFTILVNKWLYTFFTAFLFSCLGTSSMFSGLISKQFGKNNFSSNFGVFGFVQIGLLLLLPSAIDNFVFYFGWFALPFLPFVPAALALISIIVFMPNYDK